MQAPGPEVKRNEANFGEEAELFPASPKAPPAETVSRLSQDGGRQADRLEEGPLREAHGEVHPKDAKRSKRNKERRLNVPDPHLKNPMHRKGD